MKSGRVVDGVYLGKMRYQRGRFEPVLKYFSTSRETAGLPVVWNEDGMNPNTLIYALKN